jgi:hypothetical protein
MRSAKRTDSVGKQGKTEPLIIRGERALGVSPPARTFRPGPAGRDGMKPLAAPRGSHVGRRVESSGDDARVPGSPGTVT